MRKVFVVIIILIGFSLYPCRARGDVLKNSRTDTQRKIASDRVVMERWEGRIRSIIKTGKLPIIDTQVTYGKEVNVPEFTKLMDDLGVGLVAFAPKFRDPSKGSIESLELYKRYPDYFVPTTTDGSTEYWYRQSGPFIDKVEEEVKSGEYYFMGEHELARYIPSRKFKTEKKGHAVYIRPDSLWMHSIFRLSSETQITFQIHCDPEDGLLKPLEKMLGKYPDALVIWCHVGQIRYPERQTIYSPAYVNKLLSKYQNLYFDLAVGTPGRVYPGSSFIHNTLQNLDGTLVKEWKTVIEKYPTRFTVASDIGPDRWKIFPEKIKRARDILSSLSVPTAERVAYKNAWYLITRTEWVEECNKTLQENQQSNRPIKIGYAHGGRAAILWRSYINKYFEDEGVNVEFYSKYLHKDGFYKVSKHISEMNKKSGDYNYFGVIGGEEIIEAIQRREFEGGTVGMPSFVYAANNNSPIMAVAALVYDASARAIVIRSDIVINSPEDFKGKILSTQRTGPGAIIFLKEFLESIGLDPEKDVTIIEQISEDKLYGLVKEKKVDGGYWHSPEASRLIEEGLAYRHRRMDWMNPEISHALLVFRKDFVETHPEEVKKIIRAYMKRIKYEHSIPIKKEKGSFCQTDYPPLIYKDLLNEMQRLLLKYEFIDREVDLENFINNDFVREAYEELK